MSQIPYYQLVRPSREELRHSGINWVSGVPDWFVRRCQRGMNFDLGEIDEQKKDRKMIKPPQVDHNNWVLLKDPKSTEVQIPPLSKSQVRKIQRRYTACHGKVTSTDKKQVLKTEAAK